MDRAEMEKRVRRVLSECLDKPIRELRPDARFQEDLDVDSLNREEALVALEEEFEIELSEKELEAVRTVRGAVDLVARAELKATPINT